MRQSAARIQAVLHNAAGRKPLGPDEAHARNVEAIGRTIARLVTERTRLRKRDKAISAELRAKRRELRAVLQRTPTPFDDRAHDLAGNADAIDAANARHERKE